MRVGAVTGVGQVRSQNEDRYWHDNHVFVVCDGMGGHQAGEIASQIAVETIEGFSFLLADPVQEVASAVDAAHTAICDAAAANPEYSGMGTTLTMGLVHQGEEGLLVTIGHVGDSRAYLQRDSQLRQLTSDHSVAAELARQGTLSGSEAESHPSRHMLTQALGVGSVDASVETFSVESNDILLFCSDGLTDVVSDEDIRRVLDSHCPQAAAEELLASANAKGGPDNITVLVVEL